MSDIPPFNESELWTIRTTLKERFREEKDVELAETELRLDPHSTQLTPCPAAYWRHGDCHFVIAKTGDERYRCVFFYRVHQMFGTGIEEFDNLTECTVTLLQVQADHEAKRREEEGAG
ncbi:MAG TPA: hypothetical protein ENJ05_05360 [Thiotrichales bacterium]|nr:hypothetical protein [Thiotrichales bacterium]